MRILVVGAGLSGCTVARTLAEAGHNLHIIEKRNHIAGNCYDVINHQGIRVSQYGAHLFHTNSERVWDYVQRFAEWVPWRHQVVGHIKDKWFPIPVNRTTICTLLGVQLETEDDVKQWLARHAIPCENPQNSEDVAVQRVGHELYEAIFHHYTYKQWAKYPSELDPSVLARIPVRTDDNADYFSDRFQALPKEGYTAFVERMVDHPHIRISLNTEYHPDMRADYDAICYTGPIDQYFTGHPPLEYRSIRFETEYLEVDQFQSNSVVNYPSPHEPYTRIVEYKHFLNQHAPGKTTIVKEYTMAEGEPYYPVPNPANQARYEEYRARAEKETGVYFVGRLANYKYYNMDAAIENALQFASDFILSH